MYRICLTECGHRPTYRFSLNSLYSQLFIFLDLKEFEAVIFMKKIGGTTLPGGRVSRQSQRVRG